MVVTERPDDESQRDWARVLQMKSPRQPYSRVHGTIAAARKILASVPSKNLETPFTLPPLQSLSRLRIDD
jgi:hypothetical protein